MEAEIDYGFHQQREHTGCTLHTVQLSLSCSNFSNPSLGCSTGSCTGMRTNHSKPHCSETIFNPNVEELTVFFHIIIFHIYMDNFIAFLKYFTEGRVKKCPFCTQQWLKTTFEWPKVVSEVSFPRFWGVLWGGLFSEIFRFGDQKCRFRDIAISAFLRKIEKNGLFLVFLKLLEILI